MRALAISGGGCKGAFAGGVAEYLIRDIKRDYDLFIGTSTGSLLIPFLAIDEIEKIKKAYTSVTQSDIYNVCPFTIKKDKDGKILHTKINHLNTLKMFLKGKKTFGEHNNLRKTIDKIYSEEDFIKGKASGKKVIVTVSNLTKNIVEYKYLRDCSYKDFADWMWMSSSFVPFMSLGKKNGYEYADGGFGNIIPIEEAIDNGATEIDVIVLNPRHMEKVHSETTNAFEVFMRTFQFVMRQSANNDILIGHLESIHNDDVRVNFIFTPYLLTEHSFYFDPTQMKKWWGEGYEYAKSKYGDKKKA